MKWLDDIRDGAEAFRAWAKMLTIICAVIAIAVVAIAIELLVVCCKLEGVWLRCENDPN